MPTPLGVSDAGLQTLLTTMQQIVVAIGNLNQAIVNQTAAIFPQTQGTATTATGGATITLPTHPTGYFEVKAPDGSTKKVAYYDP